LTLGVPSAAKVNCNGWKEHFDNSSLPPDVYNKLFHNCASCVTFSIVYPNTTLRPDWDLLEEIVASYRQIDAHQIDFEWVKGHQDLCKHDNELTPQALLNIRADEIAIGTTQALGTILFPQTPLLSSTRCHLAINTGQYRHHLRLSSSEPHLFENLTLRHQWDPHVIDIIDWTEVHLLKLVHDKLPLRRQVSRHQPWTSKHCHYCSADNTMDHLQTSLCNPVSVTFRSEICKKVQTYLIQRSCPSSFTLRFISTLQTWLDLKHPQPSSIIPPEQITIGIQLLTRGLLTRRWRQVLSQSITNTFPPGTLPLEHELTCMLARLIKTMWECVGQLWLNHLATIHETAKTTQSPVTIASLRDCVRLIHALQADTLPIHAHYFHSDLEGFLAKSSLSTPTSRIICPLYYTVSQWPNLTQNLQRTFLFSA
jgi:hypothetical protein